MTEVNIVKHKLRAERERESEPIPAVKDERVEEEEDGRKSLSIDYKHKRAHVIICHGGFSPDC